MVERASEEAARDPVGEVDAVDAHKCGWVGEALAFDPARGEHTLAATLPVDFRR